MFAPWFHLAAKYGQHPIRFIHETTPWQVLVLLEHDNEEWNQPDRHDYYLMAIRGSWLKGWNGDCEQLKLVFGDPDVKPDASKMDQVPDGWTPPTKEEIEKAMGASRLSFSQVQDRAKRTGDERKDVMR